jgi:hypothetical protein
LPIGNLWSSSAITGASPGKPTARRIRNNYRYKGKEEDKKTNREKGMIKQVKKSMITALMLSCLLLPTLLRAGSGDLLKLDFSGYFENRFFLVNNTEVKWDDFNDKFKLGDYNRLRLKLKASPAKNVRVNVAVDFFSFHGVMTTPMGTVDSPGDAGSGGRDVEIDLDRAYVDLYFKAFDLSIGKQRVAMGVSYLWAPLDIFNRVNVFEPKEEKPGTNAFKVYVPLGTSSSITGVFSPEEDFKGSRYGIRGKSQLGGIDLGVTLIRSGTTDTTIYGLDLRGENFVGWWVEAGYFVSTLNGLTEKNEKIVLGFDYTFPIKDGLYWLNEFFYDASGAKEPVDYDYQAVMSGERFTMGRTYFFSMLRYRFSDFLTGSVSYIGNWGDGSYILNPSIQYEVSQSVLVSTGFYFPMGKGSGEFNSQKRNMFFVWLKVNF